MGKHKKALSKNPKNEKTTKRVNWELIISSIASLSAVVSIVISIITVGQMIEDRNAAYRPAILINPTKYSFSWDQEGNLEWLNSLIADKQIENDVEINDDGTIIGSVSVPINVIGDGVEQFTAVNVGVGSAKQITFKWHESNMTNLNNYLIQCDETKKDFLEIGKSVAFDYNGRIIGMGVPSNMSLMYMLPEATETYDLPLPTAYFVLIQEIIKVSGNSNSIPQLILSVEYSDIQGNSYINNFAISIQTQLYSEELTGAGKATFQLVPLLEK